MRTTITVGPSLREILTGERPASGEELLQALEAFADTPGIAGTPLGDEVEAAITGDEDEVDAFSFGPIDDLVRWFEGEENRVVGSEVADVTVAAYWLTLPAVADAEVTVTAAKTRGTENSGSVTILGIGGGPTFTIEISDEDEFTAKANEHVVLTYRGLFERVETYRHGDIVNVFARLASLDDSEQTLDRGPAEPPDPAGYGRPVFERTFKLSQASGVSKRSLTMKRGQTWELGGELELKSLGLKAGLTSKLSYETELKYTWELPAGRDYVARKYAQHPAHYWDS